MKHIILSMFSLISFCLLTSAAHAGDWVFIKERDGIKIYKRNIEGSEFGAFKGEGIISGPIEKVASIIFDNSRATEWVDSLKESRVLKWEGSDQYVQYNYISTPFVIKDRDFVSRVKIDIEPGGKKMTFVSGHAEESSMPPGQKAIRGEVIRSVYTLTETEDGKNTDVIGEIHADPKGSVPAWIVNFFQQDWPIAALKSMRKQAKKDVPLHPKLLPLFEKAKAQGLSPIKRAS